MTKDNMVRGLDIDSKALKEQRGDECEPWIIGKSHRLPFPEKAELIHMSVQERMEVARCRGARWIATFTDDHSHFAEMQFLKTKAEGRTPSKLSLCCLINRRGARSSGSG
jgi:hypothetical protein